MNRLILPSIINPPRIHKDGSCSVSFDTRELSAEEIVTIMGFRNSEGWLCFAPNENQLEIPETDAEVDEKSPSERLKAVLYVWYKQETESGKFVGLFDSFRKEKMEKIIEIKSVGSFIFEDLLSKDNPRTHHMLQAAVYKLAKDLPTDIVYVCRDDCRLLQYSIDSITPQLEKEIKEDLTQITDYHRKNVVPPKEDLLIWDSLSKKFKTNWKIQYSPYLSMLYTYIGEDGKEKPIETPDEYFEAFSPLVSSWNRVITRIKEGKNMTKSNLEKIKEMESKGFPLSGLGFEVKHENKQSTS